MHLKGFVQRITAGLMPSGKKKRVHCHWFLYIHLLADFVKKKKKKPSYATICVNAVSTVAVINIFAYHLYLYCVIADSFSFSFDNCSGLTYVFMLQSFSFV